MLEAYNCPFEVLNDANICYAILNDLPGEIGMTKMTLPYVVKSEGNDKKDPGGWTGFVIINESHISLHTFAKRGYVTVDVYSCREFDTEFAVDYFKKAFQSDDVEFKVEVRGERYPEKNLDR